MGDSVVMFLLCLPGPVAVIVNGGGGGLVVEAFFVRCVRLQSSPFSCLQQLHFYMKLLSEAHWHEVKYHHYTDLVSEGYGLRGTASTLARLSGYEF